MTLYIHIGIGKTGTSAIQHFFYNNRDAFFEKGLIYPDIGLQGDVHNNLAHLHCGHIPEETMRHYHKLRDLVDAHSKHSILLSSEKFCFVHPTYVQEIAEIFQGCEVVVIFYVRDQVQLIESAFMQFQKVGQNYGGSIERFFALAKSAFDFMERITPWAEAFGKANILARLYDKRIIGNDVRLDFLRLIGLDGAVDVGELCIYNESLPTQFSNLITLYDATYPDPKARQAFINELFNISKCIKFTAKHTLIDDRLRALIEETYKDSNEEFAKTFLDAEQGELLCQRTRHFT